eukprot:scaffold234883_cov31-Tisochrysis_lutea.AAC.1
MRGRYARIFRCAGGVLADASARQLAFIRYPAADDEQYNAFHSVGFLHAHTYVMRTGAGWECLPGALFPSLACEQCV